MLAFLRLALLAILAQAQNPQQLLITVTDSAGDRVPNATITLTQGNVERTLTSGPDGRASISDLALGEWKLSVKSEGFATMQRPVVIQGVPVNVTVPLGNATETLKVEVEDRLRIANDAARQRFCQRPESLAGGRSADRITPERPESRARQKHGKSGNRAFSSVG